MNFKAKYGPNFPLVTISKIVHPTSLLIAAQTSAGSLDELMPLIDGQAKADLLAIVYAVEEHIAKHGIRWQTETLGEP